MNKALLWANGLLVALVVVLGVSQLQPQRALGGTTRANTTVAANFTVTGSSTLTDVSFSGVSNLSGSLNASGSAAFDGTVRLTGETTLGNCGTTTFTVPGLSGTLSVSGDSYASTTVSVTGMAVGDVTLVSIGTSTPAARELSITAHASTSIAVVNFQNLLTVTSTAITTSTITVCYFN